MHQIELASVVPWGRSYDEYVAMFALTESDLTQRILGCGDGPASFNAELTARGGSVISIDPIYAFTAAEIRTRIDEVIPDVLELARVNYDTFVWESIASVEDLRDVRLAAMQRFLEDFECDVERSRYMAQSLPNLSFAEDPFDIALCSHMLFTYSNVLDAAFHAGAILEMCRVAREARVFPLLDMKGQRSAHLDGVLDELRASGLDARIVSVDYEFQRGGNEMLVAKRR